MDGVDGLLDVLIGLVSVFALALRALAGFHEGAQLVQKRAVSCRVGDVSRGAAAAGAQCRDEQRHEHGREEWHRSSPIPMRGAHVVALSPQLGPAAMGNTHRCWARA